MDGARLYGTLLRNPSIPIEMGGMANVLLSYRVGTAAVTDRSIANMVEVLIWEYYGCKGITIPKQQVLFLNNDRKHKGLPKFG